MALFPNYVSSNNILKDTNVNLNLVQEVFKENSKGKDGLTTYLIRFAFHAESKRGITDFEYDDESTRDAEYVALRSQFFNISGGVVNCYIVLKDTNALPTVDEITAGIAIGITHGQQSVTYPTQSDSGDKWIFLCEPITEPAKTYKYITESNQEYLGSDAEFSVGNNVGSAFYVYASNYPTSMNLHPIILKVTAS